MLLRRRADLVKPLLPEEEWARVQAYTLADAGFGTDPFGTNPDALGLGYAIGYWLHRHYFRVESSGHEHIPGRGAAVIVGNHSGVLPFDAVMLGVDVFRFTDPPRLMRFMVDYFVYRVPFLGVFFRSLGQMPGTRRNFDGLVEEGHVIGIFPEGAHALAKPVERRYELLPFSHGHIELAARHDVPVVPFGLVGAEEQMTMLTDLRPLARALRLPYFPITTTFPWLGPAGLLPKPVRYYINYGAPIHVDREALDSVDVREREVERVRETVADLIQRGLEQRREVEGLRS